MRRTMTRPTLHVNNSRNVYTPYSVNIMDAAYEGRTMNASTMMPNKMTPMKHVLEWDSTMDGSGGNASAMVGMESSVDVTLL